jgi:hypothetical protein
MECFANPLPVSVTPVLSRNTWGARNACEKILPNRRQHTFESGVPPSKGGLGYCHPMRLGGVPGVRVRPSSRRCFCRGSANLSRQTAVPWGTERYRRGDALHGVALVSTDTRLGFYFFPSQRLARSACVRISYHDPLVSRRY